MRMSLTALCVGSLIAFAVAAPVHAQRAEEATKGSRIYGPKMVKGKLELRQYGFVLGVVQRNGQPSYRVDVGKNAWYAWWKKEERYIAVATTTAVRKPNGKYNVFMRRS